jgi:hypothetical protein
MSDDPIMDEEEIQEMMEDMDPDAMKVEDLFTMVLLNKRNRTKVSVSLEDGDGDTIKTEELIEELVNYLKDKFDDEEGNQIVDQILPLMSQTLISGLGRLVGIPQTAFLISNPSVRMSLLYMMVIAFTLYKTVQVKELKILTEVEDVSEEEIEEIERKSQASSTATMASFMGQDPKEILQQMVERGDITEQDLEDLLGSESKSDEKDDDN